MTILIKGIDMPREGASLFIEVNPTGHIICQYSDDIVHYGYKNRAVPVPTPHGRLGDLDALMELYEPAPEDVNEWEHYKTTISVIRQNIKDAPTIIEAEEGEDDVL